jgi:hypothetical protein
VAFLFLTAGLENAFIQTSGFAPCPARNWRDFA